MSPEQRLDILEGEVEALKAAFVELMDPPPARTYPERFRSFVARVRAKRTQEDS